MTSALSILDKILDKYFSFDFKNRALPAYGRMHFVKDAECVPVIRGIGINLSSLRSSPRLHVQLQRTGCAGF
jgi:hypothetical protein